MDDIEELKAKLDQIAGANKKGVLAVRGTLQQGALRYAIANGIGVFRLLEHNEVRWVSYCIRRGGGVHASDREDYEKIALTDPNFRAENRSFYSLDMSQTYFSLGLFVWYTCSIDRIQLRPRDVVAEVIFCESALPPEFTGVFSGYRAGIDFGNYKTHAVFEFTSGAVDFGKRQVAWLETCDPLHDVEHVFTGQSFTILGLQGQIVDHGQIVSVCDLPASARRAMKGEPFLAHWIDDSEEGHRGTDAQPL